MINFLYVEKIKDTSNTLRDNIKENKKQDEITLSFFSDEKSKKPTSNTPSLKTTRNTLNKTVVDDAEVDLNEHQICSKKLGVQAQQIQASSQSTTDIMIEYNKKYALLKDKYQKLIQTQARLHIANKQLQSNQNKILKHFTIIALNQLIEVNFTPKCIQAQAYYLKWPEFTEQEVLSKFKNTYNQVLSDLSNLEATDIRCTDTSYIQDQLIQKFNQAGLFGLSSPKMTISINQYLGF